MNKPDFTCPECGVVLTSDIFSADKMRRRFFAHLREDVWGSLKEEHVRRFPSPEILRKHALIAVGHCDVRTVVAGSRSAAPDLAKAFEAMDSYAIVTVQGDVITIYQAKSMARRFLLKPQFNDVAEKVWTWIYQQTGIDGRMIEAS
jgi:hypothetical protein